MFNYHESNSESIEFIPIAKEADLPDGERLFVEVDDLAIVVFKIAGKFFAIGDICSHDDGPLGEGEIEDNIVICPRHGARFDLQTGQAKTLPAYVDIPAYPVQVIDDQIEIGVPFDE